MATYRTRKTGRTTVLIVVGVVFGFLLSIGVDWVGSWF
jgi:preprotein translocase subunit SecE